MGGYTGQRQGRVGSKLALVSLFSVLLRRRVPGERAASSGEWDVRACFSEPVRIATRCRLVLLDGQCFVGPVQPCRRLPAGLSCRQFQSAQDATRPRPGGGRSDHVGHACPYIRKASRWSLRLASTDSPAAQQEGRVPSRYYRNGGKIVITQVLQSAGPCPW
jgi:hypothetical protein